METVQVLVSLIIGFTCQQTLPQQARKPELQQSGASRAIARIRIEVVFLRRKNDKWVESERVLSEETEYDRLGNIIHQKRIPLIGSGILGCAHEEYKYDDKKRRIERSCMDAGREDFMEEYSYEDDRFWNWTKLTVSVPDGTGSRAKQIVIGP